MWHTYVNFLACHLPFNFVYDFFEVQKFENVVVKSIALSLYYFIHCFVLGKFFPTEKAVKYLHILSSRLFVSFLHLIVLISH